MTTILGLGRITLATTPNEIAAATGGQAGRVSIFGIILVGLVAGLIVGLITSPGYTAQGFFLGFAGGSLITVVVYIFRSQGSRSSH